MLCIVLYNIIYIQIYYLNIKIYRDIDDEVY